MKLNIIFLLFIRIFSQTYYYIKVNSKQYNITFEDSTTSKELISKLPLCIKMNGDVSHEKYYRFSDITFTTNTYSPEKIEKGDIMLYLNNYLVIFYETFSTTYSYTRLGKISSSIDGLEDSLGNNSNSVEVYWGVSNILQENCENVNNNNNNENSNNDNNSVNENNNNDDSNNNNNNDDSNNNNNNNYNDSSSSNSKKFYEFNKLLKLFLFIFML